MRALMLASDRAMWERFQEGRFAPDDVAASPVLARWARVASTGMRGDTPGHAVGVANDQVRDLCERLEPLTEPFDVFAESVSDAGFIALLTDASGVVVRRLGGAALEPLLLSTRLVEGACWGEDVRGTNAIGTAAIERAPVAVIGAAHFEQRNHGLVCYAAPIRDVRGDVIAILDASGPVAAAGSFAHAAVVAAASAMELLVIGRAYDQAVIGGLFALQRSIGELAHPAFIVEPTGRVRAANAAARALLPPEVLREAGAFLDARAPRDARIEIEHLGDVAALVHLLPRARPRTPQAPAPHPAFAAIVGSDPDIAAARDRAAKFARSELPVLLLAETGTGKELFARAVHAASARANGPFVAVNCGALTGSLLESELFGYAPGAFTGARASGANGKLAAAHGGTLFLDEVAEMPAPLQAMLLRFLEDGSYYRLGESIERRADVRIVAATCRDLPAMVEERLFRNDLYYRIRGVTIRLPSLRERRDRGELARALIERLAERHGRRPPTLSRAAVSFIESSTWPGNVRELRTALEHALILAGDVRELEVEHFPGDARPTEREPLRKLGERDALLRALDEAGGNLSEAARLLGVARTTLYRMMQRHGVRAS